MTVSYDIPFNRASMQGAEPDYMAQAAASGHISGDEPFGRRCQAIPQKSLGVLKALLTTSCTDALEMCALLLNLGPSDEVIVPAFTFVSSINAIVLRGVRPVFIDVRPDTLNLNENLLERLITSRTRAIIAVHYAGVGSHLYLWMAKGFRRLIIRAISP